jgi:hypothetical protein
LALAARRLSTGVDGCAVSNWFGAGFVASGPVDLLRRTPAKPPIICPL